MYVSFCQLASVDLDFSMVSWSLSKLHFPAVRKTICQWKCCEDCIWPLRTSLYVCTVQSFQFRDFISFSRSNTGLVYRLKIYIFFHYWISFNGVFLFLLVLIWKALRFWAAASHQSRWTTGCNFGFNKQTNYPPQNRECSWWGALFSLSALTQIKPIYQSKPMQLVLNRGPFGCTRQFCGSGNFYTMMEW